MRLTFLGSGTSMGVPVVGCACPVCMSPDPYNHRTRTSALLQVAGQYILIDAGPDFRSQALAQGIMHLDAVLLTHSHYDHVAGLDDLRPLADSSDPMPIYGNRTTLEQVRERFSYAFTPSSDASTRPALDLMPIENYTPFSIGPVNIIPFDVIHGTWTITGFRIGRLGYVTDASELPPATLDLLRNLDVLVLNALRFTPHPTHFNLEQALAVIADLRPRRAFLVHTNHAFDYQTVNATLPPNVALAHDGLDITISGE
jgi:phosphoribosyl 1,2-cyclic phosphate phosphodiesterase